MNGHWASAVKFEFPSRGFVWNRREYITMEFNEFRDEFLADIQLFHPCYPCVPSVSFLFGWTVSGTLPNRPVAGSMALERLPLGRRPRPLVLRRRRCSRLAIRRRVSGMLRSVSDTRECAYAYGRSLFGTRRNCPTGRNARFDRL